MLAAVLAWPHWIIVPIVLPLMAGAALVLVERRSPAWASRLGLVATLSLLLVAAGLLARAQAGPVQAYLLGNWQAPFGIALALDRLSATMVLLTAVVAVATVLYARGGDESRGPHFHAFFQFQLMGLNGAFLTADLFNLFVFFEVLLIASYALLLHGAGRERLKQSVHYVSVNLTGSALFLIAVSLLYGLTGTLNMADLAQRLAVVSPDRTLLAQSAALLLLVVFGIKAALLPLYFWLPGTYGAASAPVAALFAIMTKVGLYAVLRTTTLMFGEGAGPLAGVAGSWLLAVGLATVAAGAIGALAARRLRGLVGYGVVVSAGTLLTAIGLGTPAAAAAALFYLVNTTLATAALFLLADRIAAARASREDALHPSAMDEGRVPLAVAFLALAVAAAGLPPLAGFLGKALILQAAGVHAWAIPVITALLASSLLLVVAYGRAGSALFWESHLAGRRAGGPPTSTPVEGRAAHDFAIGLLLGLLLASAVFAGPLSRHVEATAAQLFDPAGYRKAVLGAQPVPPAFDVRREMRDAGLEKRPPPSPPPAEPVHTTSAGPAHTGTPTRPAPGGAP